jgi:hypothetical protein
MRIRKLVVAAAIMVGVLAVPATAFADSCGNVSRAPGPCGIPGTPACTGPVVVGNWLWLPSVGGPPIWGFAPPGGPDSILFGAPGQNGNYGVNKPDALLSGSNNCPPGNNTARQTTNGIQSGCVS